MIYIRLDQENYIIEFSKRSEPDMQKVSEYPKLVGIRPHEYQYINNQFIHNPRAIELETEN